MQKFFSKKSKLLTFIFFIFFINTLSFALLLPETPDGKTGKNYQLYGVANISAGISKRISDHYIIYNALGLRSNLGTDYFDFGVFFNNFSPYPGLSAGIKYGFIQNKNLSCAIDFSFSKPFTDSFILKTGAACNLTLLPIFDIIFSSYYIYSFSETKPVDEMAFPKSYEIFLYTGIEFIPPFLIDNTITLGCGYLYLPENLPDNQKIFNQFYINLFTRYALNEPRVEKKSLSSSNNIKKDEKQEKNINENILIAKELIKIKEYKKAILLLSDALYFYPDNFILNYLLADCYYNTGDKIKAYIYYKKASKINAVDHKLKDFLINLETEIKHEKN